MFKTLITPPHSASAPADSEAQRISARLDAAVEAAYILEAVRRYT